KQRFELAPLVNVARHEQKKALGQSEDLAARAPELRPRTDAALVAEFHQAVFSGLNLRPGVEISCDHAAIVVRQQIESLVASDRAADDDVRETRQALALILL